MVAAEAQERREIIIANHKINSIIVQAISLPPRFYVQNQAELIILIDQNKNGFKPVREGLRSFGALLI